MTREEYILSLLLETRPANAGPLFTEEKKEESCQGALTGWYGPDDIDDDVPEGFALT